ncbi:MAG: Hsp70 family protein, partial [Thermoguttaceae bacterium]
MKHNVGEQSGPSRYAVGFDLGTTNSAVCYVDTQESPWRVRTFAVPQLVAPGQVEARETLPSFHYQPARGEFPAEAMRLPWQGAEGRVQGSGFGVQDSAFGGQDLGGKGKKRGKGKDKELGYAVGFFARDQGTLAPGRLINSAKSWLCHSGVDRTAGLLPWHGADDVDRLSPVEVSARYLAHVRDAWNARFPREPLEKQDFVLTLPASFDEVARELTVKAAAAAGLPRVVLIEEPQAAFYAWIYTHQDDWDRLVEPGQKILVCDIGGGTSDFTLIRVRRGEGGKVQFHRVAVGDHLILGGDNLDLALAKYIEKKLSIESQSQNKNVADNTSEESPHPSPLPKGEGTQPSPHPSPLPKGEGTIDIVHNVDIVHKLEPRQWAVLVRTCRSVKETLLGKNAPERLTVNLPGAGSRLIGGGIHVEVSGQEVRDLLVEGFFPRVGLDAKPAGRRSGFQEFGLPFASDPAVTRYLAAFLTAHRHVAMEDIDISEGHDPARPDIVLFNGGVFESPLLRERLLEVIESWFSSPTEHCLQAGHQPKVGRGTQMPWQASSGTHSKSLWQPVILDNDRLDLAVARGAAYYGMVRRGQGVRIAAGLGRTYYIGVEKREPDGGERGVGQEGGEGDKEYAGSAICLVPANAEPGHDVELAGRRFDLLVSEPVEFPLFISSTRLTDKPGELVAIDRERMTPLPPIRTVLKTRKKGEGETVSVALHARLTEIGTLDLWCGEIGGRRSWRLQFDVRSATQTDVAAHESAAEQEGFIDEAVWLECEKLIRGVFGLGGGDRPEGLIKRLTAATGMNRNAWPTSLCRRMWEALMEVEAGRRRGAVHEVRWLNLLGFALRPGFGLAVDDWRVAQTWTALSGKFAFPSSRAEGWILWRRIAGGLGAGQQQALAEPLIGPIRGLYKQLTTGKGRGGDLSFASRETAEMWRLLGAL